ncbi:hypothetical protein GCM10011430_00340 [Oxalicibacterium solurbis]|uniref:Uncharacterized protein n=2 Tax=Oxalicibacterium solurbis TaxID=69280 RepID=A0A8J3B130_9BURK|nr:hypothetical protein GCM10011430_00340 [Oxalicibacterium solurbis]
MPAQARPEGRPMKTYAVALTADEGSLIVQALAERPFKDVFALVASLNRQANGFAGGDGGRRDYTMNAAELALAVRALGALPFDRVCGLIADLNAQIRQQQDAACAAD